jgi:hypothetical protein
MHLIDYSPMHGFPKVWHKIEDDGQHLDMDTVEDWSLLVTGFAAEWMELEGFIKDAKITKDESAAKKKRSDKTEL